jgi:hypothetical protein
MSKTYRRAAKTLKKASQTLRRDRKIKRVKVPTPTGR